MALVSVMVAGRTGDGKSTVCKSLAHYLGATDVGMFHESGSVHSTLHSHGVVSCQIAGFDILDTPGLMDVGGVKQDEANIGMIVAKAVAQKYIHAFILVVNEQAPRFDDGMQAAVKLLVDSFGPRVLAHMGILFTRADGRISRTDSLAKASNIAQLISQRTGVPIEHMPSWQIECHPEAFQGIMLQERVDALKNQLKSTSDDMLRWVKTRPKPLDTTGAVIGEYEAQKQKRLAEDAAHAAKAERDAAVTKANEEQRKREAAEARAREAEDHTFLSLTRGFKIAGKRIW
jgi:hypothetical protein